MMENDDLLVKAFFESNKQPEITDDGFSEQVMRQLPQSRKLRAERVWTFVCCIAGIALFLALNGLGRLKDIVFNFIANAIGGIVYMESAPISLTTVGIAVVTIMAVAFYNFVEKEENSLA